MAISIENLRPADREARHRLEQMGFGHTRPYVESQSLPDEDVAAAYDGDELVASAALVHGGHWFGGCPVSGHAITSVAVAPHRRGTGVARPLMTEVVRQLHERGDAVSGLYPTTAQLYRSVGWELAGDWMRRRIAVGEISPSVRGEEDVVAFDIDDLDELAPSYDALARLGSGHVARGDRWWWFRKRRFERAEGQGYLLRTEVDGRSGYIILRSGSSDRGIIDLEIEDLGAEDGRVLASLGGLMSRFGTVADMVGATQPSWVLEPMTGHGQRWRVQRSFGWMLRIVDVSRAFGQRGWPPLDCDLTLTIDDPILTANRGTFRFTFSGGRCRVEPVDAEAPSLDVRPLAAWFTGWRSASQLVHLGLLGSAADPETLRLMDALTAGPTPIIPEFY